MALSLAQQAAATEEDASALQAFLEEMPVSDRSIELNVQSLLNLAATLRNVDDDLRRELDDVGRIDPRIRDEVRLVQQSIQQTHDAIYRDLFQQSVVFGRDTRHQVLWEELERQFRQEGCKLYSRLELYITFLDCIIEGLERLVCSSQRLACTDKSQPPRQPRTFPQFAESYNATTKPTGPLGHWLQST